jgi:urease accessory protein
VGNLGSVGNVGNVGNGGNVGNVGWQAAIDLGFAAEGGTTHLARRAHRGPLVVQRPFRPEGPGVCHVYLLHPPGGLVGGDELRVDVDVAAGAHALVTTPAAGKIYRTNGAAVRQTQRLTVAGRATLEWLPQEAILYDGARATLETRVELQGDARFIGIDAVCFGLPARRAPFERGRCRQMLELRRDGRPLLVERGCYDPGSGVMSARWGLGGATVLALLVAAPAPDAATVEGVRALAATGATSTTSTTTTGGDIAAVTVIGDGDVLVARHVGGDAERARAFLHAAWRLVRPPLLGRAAVPPRVWAT